MENSCRIANTLNTARSATGRKDVEDICKKVKRQLRQQNKIHDTNAKDETQIKDLFALTLSVPRGPQRSTARKNRSYIWTQDNKEVINLKTEYRIGESNCKLPIWG